MRDRWYISVHVANVIKRLSSAAGASRQWSSCSASESSAHAGGGMESNSVPCFVSFVCGSSDSFSHVKGWNDQQEKFWSGNIVLSAASTQRSLGRKRCEHLKT